MQNILLLNPCNDNDRFANISSSDLSETEQLTLTRLVIEVLQMRHRPGEYFNSPEMTRSYLQLHLSERKNETFGALFMDNKNRLIANEELFTGSASSASVYPRVVVQRALECNSSAIIFYHNHPSGDPKPSQSDIDITKRLVSALKLIDVRVPDHFVIGNEGTVSFAEQGLI